MKKLIAFVGLALLGNSAMAQSGSFPLEVNGGYIDFTENSEFRDTYYVGAATGINFTDNAGIRGYYWKALDDGSFTDLDKLEIYGAETKVKAPITRHFKPYLVVGGGIMKPYGNYMGKNNQIVTKDKFFGNAGAGIDLSFINFLSVTAYARTMISEFSQLNNVDNIVDQKIDASWNYGASINFNIGRKGIQRSNKTSASEVTFPSSHTTERYVEQNNTITTIEKEEPVLFSKSNRYEAEQEERNALEAEMEAMKAEIQLEKEMIEFEKDQRIAELENRVEFLEDQHQRSIQKEELKREIQEELMFDRKFSSTMMQNRNYGVAQNTANQFSQPKIEPKVQTREIRIESKTSDEDKKRILAQIDQLSNQIAQLEKQSEQNAQPIIIEKEVEVKAPVKKELIVSVESATGDVNTVEKEVVVTEKATTKEVEVVEEQTSNEISTQQKLLQQELDMLKTERKIIESKKGLFKKSKLRKINEEIAILETAIGQ